MERAFTKIDSLYFDYLLSKIYKDEIFEYYICMLDHLHRVPFDTFLIPNDYNRACDGLDIRTEFVNDLEDHPELVPGQDWMELPCSMLELFIAMAIRMSTLSEKSETDCFWEMISNVGLDISRDDYYFQDDVNDCLERFISRSYNSDGTDGGAFPVPDIDDDLRSLELIFQMYKYLNNNKED